MRIASSDEINEIPRTNMFERAVDDSCPRRTDGRSQRGGAV